MGNVWCAGSANDFIVVKQPDGTLRCTAENVRLPHQRDVANRDKENVSVSINEATMANVWSAGFANDIIVVKQPDGTLRCSAVNVRFPHQDDFANWNEENVSVSINGTVLNFSLNELNPRKESNDGGYRFSSSCLEEMRLQPDLNDITFTFTCRGHDVQVKARMFLWRSDSRIVITDVDGTITKSDVRGFFSDIFKYDWTQDGVCHLFSAIQKNGYKVIYLTGRPGSLAEATRNFLDGLVQDGEGLPKGPVLLSPKGWGVAFYREVCMRTFPVLTKIHDANFKTPMLQQVRKLFPDFHSKKRKEAGPFHAGFGNRPSDASTYRKFRIPFDCIFCLNRSKGGLEVKRKGKIAAFFPDNYNGLSSFVDKFFPKRRILKFQQRKKGFSVIARRVLMLLRIKKESKSLLTPLESSSEGL